MSLTSTARTKLSGLQKFQQGVWISTDVHAYEFGDLHIIQTKSRYKLKSAIGDHFRKAN